jgi:protein-disulfide isomerase
MTHSRSQYPAKLAVPVTAEDHIQGSATAPITLVEYGDYQCPFCGAAYPVVKAIQKAAGNQLRLVFRNMPLSEMHPHAELAAEAAEAAAAQGKFWEMHDALYEHQEELGIELIARLVKQLGLDAGKFELALKQGTFRERVRRDFMGGVRSGVNGTPTFYLNGERYDGALDAESLLAAIED